MERSRTFGNAISLVLSSDSRLDERGHDLGRRPSTVLDGLNNLTSCNNVRIEKRRESRSAIRAARRNDVPFILGQFFSGDGGSPSNGFFPLDTLSVGDDLVGHLASEG